jgi:hypothetical protein
LVKQWRNEDIIAPADAQRWEDGVDKTLKENVQNAGDLKKHAEDKSNPHGVTAAQTGAYTKSESDANDQETLTTAKQYTDEKKQEANTFTSQEVAKVKTDIQNGNVASASKLNTARKINGVDFDGTKDINVTANPNQRTIPANATLDDLIEPGFWTSHSNGNTATLTNAPFGVNTFTLQVGTGLENGRIFQTAKSMGDGSVAVRRKREDTQWSGWVRLARADGTMQTGLFSETADRLRTSRKIAGVDFDGRADIAIAAGNVGAYTKGEVDKKLQDEIGNSIDNLDVATRNYLIDSHIERTGRNEFLNDPSWNLAPLIDEYGMDREYTVSFDLKSAIAGTIRVYCQNGSGAKYDIGQHPLNATTEYKRFSISFKPTKSAGFETETRSLLAFFGVYDSGRIPTVRNVSFGLGNVGGDWMPNPDELALKNDLKMSARNLLPKSSFYNGLSGWVVSAFSSVTSTGDYTRVTKGVNATRSTISINLDGIKQSTQYTIGLMVYVESVSDGATGHGTGVFLRTNDGTMQDSPVGYVDFTKVGEWQLVKATGTTRPGAWVIPAQLTIAIQANISCTIRIKEFVLVEGNHYMGWFPAPSDKADQADFEVTQQKVKSLEENTIRITNQFPDPDFSKGTPRPVAEGGIGINYNDGVGVVLNNPTAVQGRIYWGSPPLGLMVGKTYNVSMYLNAGGASAGRVFIAGTSTGDNFSFSVPNDSPVWVHGTIGLTNWSAFSVWLPPNTSLRIRELYIYEANTDITTARIERLEKDNSLPRIAPAFAAGFMTYNADPASTNYCAVERQEDWITLHGAITNTVVIPANSPAYVMCTLPVGYRPDRQERGLMQGSGSAKYLLHVETNGEVTVSRYSGHSQVGMHDAPIGSWLTTNIGYKVGG